MNRKQIANSTLRHSKLAVVALGCCLVLTGCHNNTISNALNPFYEPPPPVALLGEKNDRALAGGASNEDGARMALEAMGSYQRTLLPQPNNPVIKPAVVRLMWVPDHVNRNGDLVPAHYYYLKVKSDDWAVQDAFEMEAQLNGPNGKYGDSASNLPYVLESDKK